MKKILSMVLTVALLISLVPFYGNSAQVNAAGSFFIFPNEKYDVESARTVSKKHVELTGTLNGVIGSSISYKVQQITAAGDELNFTQSITSGILTTGDNRITVSGIELFAGLNKITFTGTRNGSPVNESIYIEYRDSPMLNDLQIIFENITYDVSETGVTMLYSGAANASSTGNINIVGYVPNASKVTVDINGDKFDFNVSSSSNDSKFSTSQLTIKKGMNDITFKVTSGNQIFETKRQVVLYNGQVTFYNEKIEHTTGSGSTATVKSFDYNYNGEYSIPSTTGLKYKGTAVIPLPLYLNGVEVSTATQTLVEDAIEAQMSASITGVTGAQAVTIDRTKTIISSGYVQVDVEFAFPSGTPPAGIEFNTPVTFTMKAPNLQQTYTTSAYKFTLRNGSLFHIVDVNYLSGFDTSMGVVDGTNFKVAANKVSSLKSLNGTDIPATGVDVYSVPMAVEMLIANPSTTLTGYTDAQMKTLISLTNSGANLGYNLMVDTAGKPVTEIVTTTVNGVSTEYLRVFLQIPTLKQSGTNTIGFNLNGPTIAVTESKNYVFKLQYGPYVKFDTIANNLSIKSDSVDPNSGLKILKELAGFRGALKNVANPSDIRYVTATNNAQSVFLYLNNVPIELEKVTNGDISSFIAKNIGADANGNLLEAGLSTLQQNTRNDILSVINRAGENTIKFVFFTPSYSYESTLKFTIVPTNLPEVPAADTDGVYPYTVGEWPALPNDPKFTKSGTTFTTKEAEFSVHGTFDFIDLGTIDSDITAKLASPIDLSDYIVQIDSPDWSTEGVNWTLADQFKVVDRDHNILDTNFAPVAPGAAASTHRIYNTANGKNPTKPYADVTVYYDTNKQNFFFEIVNQQMPIDGSPVSYVISVFNAGLGGPRATYRIEVNPISIPYTIKSPIAEERITNKNFVDVIITSPGAESMTINKEEAKPVSFIDYPSGVQKNTDAFMVTVKDLKPNKDTKIPFTITRGDTTITQTLNVKYIPTNIPGAQYLETMKASHKVFNNTLTLTFPKSTNLIRPDYNERENHATQIYNGHDLLFAIANPDDGIVDRHMFETQPPGYSVGNAFVGDIYINNGFYRQASRYIKASPMYWIDGGLADNPEQSSPKYDPITTGIDPYPFPNLADKYKDNFSLRDGQRNRQLVPNNAGSLTLTYDASIVTNAGTTVTVFRYDPVEADWENIGGVVDTKKGTITVPFEKFGYYVVTKLTRSYNDIIDHGYAREAMEAIYAKGIMNAIEPITQFGGDRYVTRGEFTRMIVKALGIPLNYSGTLHFNYYPETITNAITPEAIYDYRYIETAARAGIVNGTRPGFFDEDVQLSRQDASVMLARALELKLETDSTKAKTQLAKAFQDSGVFDFYAIPSVLAIQKKGFIQGKPISTTDPKAGYVFDPKARMLRSDAAIIMARVMKDLKKLPAIYN